MSAGALAGKLAAASADVENGEVDANWEEILDGAKRGGFIWGSTSIVFAGRTRSKPPRRPNRIDIGDFTDERQKTFKEAKTVGRHTSNDLFDGGCLP